MKRIDAEPIIDRLEALGHDLQHINPEAAHAYITAANMLNGAPRIVYNAENRHCGDCIAYQPIKQPGKRARYGNCLEGNTAREPCTKSCMKFVPAHYTRLDAIHDMTAQEFAEYMEKVCSAVVRLARQAAPEVSDNEVLLLARLKRQYWKQYIESEAKL